MSKGFERNQEHLAQLNALGRELTRRAKSKCEFCNSAGKKLIIKEAIITKQTVNIDHCLFICEECLTLLQHPPKHNPSQLHFLSTTIWNDTPIVKALAIAQVQKLAPVLPWAQELLDSVYLEPEIQDLIAQLK